MESNRLLIKNLRDFLRKDQILSSDLWREIYARDASYFDITPLCVVRPDTVEQVERLLDLASREGVGVTFRTGGTSLSGQSVNSGIICELRTAWRGLQIHDHGKRVWFEPGLTAMQVNARLKPYHTHIGPDPASSKAAMMGGILSNNSSGMSAGVTYNSYHTLSSLEFMLANGHRYNSASAADRRRFAEDERELCDGLMKIRGEIMADEPTRRRIEEKYTIKNVTGYSMNSFVDFSDPMDIFIHLLIGSEGTLAYIIAGELNTVPLYPVYTSAMLYFPDVTQAAAAAAPLGETGALSVEMMDYASLRSSLGMRSDMPAGTTAMLIDYGAESSEALADITARVLPGLKDLKGLSRFDPFTTTVAERARLWNIRDGVFPCVAGARVPGSSVILEDVAAPVGNLDRLVEGVQRIFHKHGYEGAIFGHARDGNIHPLVTTPIDTEAQIDRFRSFMDDFVDHVVALNGSLKGEHGTGRAIAPFVEREWGEKIYSMMKRVKKLADPQGVLNPGVIINSDPEAFIKPLKKLGIFGDSLGYDRADKCMECGYCEHVCPSRNITLTPRQRLQALRVIAADPANRKLRRQFRYIGNQTCCTDGSCQLPCPMGINTGVVTDAVRSYANPAILNKGLTAGARHYGDAESVIRGMLRAAVATQRVLSPYPLVWASGFLNSICKQVPRWSEYFPMPPKPLYHEERKPEFIYFPACVTRIFGASNFGKDDMPTVVLRLARKAGVSMSLPKRVHGLCCSQIWEHKGDPKGQRIAANKAVEAFFEMSDEGRIPIVCDTTSCTHTLLTLGESEGLFRDENKDKYAALKFIDITDWLARHVMPRLRISHKKKSILLHPTCASKLLKRDTVFIGIAEQCADKVTVPLDVQCCGAAGDRGFIFPEVAKSAMRDENADVVGETFDGCYSLGRTCEISMQATTGRPYESIVYLVDEVSE